MWAVILFFSALFMFWGWYFATFPYQSVSSIGTINVGGQIINVTQTTISPTANVASLEFIAFITLMVSWCILMILLGISTVLTVQKAALDEVADKMFNNRGG